jgi:hypothetical protein
MKVLAVPITVLIFACRILAFREAAQELKTSMNKIQERAKIVFF